MDDKTMGNLSIPAPLMAGALGEQWIDLPTGLQAHYTEKENTGSLETGWLTISYPRWMQWPLNIMKLMGALVNRQGEKIPTEVIKIREGNKLLWRRVIRFENGREVRFNSYMILNEQRELVEFVNRFLGLRMRASVRNGKLYYQSCGYLCRMGKLQIHIPEWLALGTAYIEETSLTDDQFAMDFWLKHPLFGEIFRYKGEFTISRRN